MSIPKLCPKVILEGTRLTLKTEIAFALNEHPRVVGPRKYRYHSPIISAEWCGFTNTPWGRGLINFAPRERRRALATYDTWLRLFEQLPYYSWIIDRFHLSTHVYQQREHGLRLDFRRLEARLARLNFRLVLCTRTPDSFAAARTQRLKVSGNPRQYDDLTVFVREQEALRAAAARSKLIHTEIDVSDDDVAGVADRIADWLAATGGLGIDESRNRAVATRPARARTRRAAAAPAARTATPTARTWAETPRAAPTRTPPPRVRKRNGTRAGGLPESGRNRGAARTARDRTAGRASRRTRR